MNTHQHFIYLSYYTCFLKLLQLPLLLLLLLDRYYHTATQHPHVSFFLFYYFIMFYIIVFFIYCYITLHVLLLLFYSFSYTKSRSLQSTLIVDASFSLLHCSLLLQHDCITASYDSRN